VLKLHLRGEDGEVIGSFRRLESIQGPLPFAMNAGMYHPDRSPVGYYVEDGVEIMRVIPNAGPGNFGLLPNGILCITPSAVRVIETLAFQQSPQSCVHATQSGPMFVIDGKLHPAFLPQKYLYQHPQWRRHYRQWQDRLFRHVERGRYVPPDGALFQRCP
jgi:uncharacterized protein YigE (DUF2233 family)